MRKLFWTACLLVLSTHAWAQSPAPAGANATPQVAAITTRPAFCPEGRTSSGACVKPLVAQASRLTSCVLTQGYISASGGMPCATALQDDTYRYPNAVYADTKRALDIALNRGSSGLNSSTAITTTTLVSIPVAHFVYGIGVGPVRTGPGTPNPTQYPIR